MSHLAYRIKKLEQSIYASNKLLDLDCYQLLHIPLTINMTQRDLQRIYNRCSNDPTSSAKNAIKY